MQKKQRIIERRKYIRLPFETKVKYKTDLSKGENLQTAKSSNISPEGMCIICGQPIERGTRLYIEITVSELPPCSLRGEVIWTKKKGDDNMVGIKLLDIDKDEKTRFLLELCDKMVNELGQKYPNIKF